MRWSSLLILLALLPANAGYGQPSVEAYVHQDTNLVFPSQIGGYRRVGARTFPDPKLGVAIRYEGPGRADVFVYNAGHTEIPTGIDSDQVKNAFAQSERNIATATTTQPFKGGAKLLEAQPTIESQDRLARLRAVAYTGTLVRRDGSEMPMLTWLLMTGYKNNFLKLIFTIPGETPDTSQQELRRLILGFLDANRGETEAFFVPRKMP